MQKTLKQAFNLILHLNAAFIILLSMALHSAFINSSDRTGCSIISKYY